MKCYAVWILYALFFETKLNRLQCLRYQRRHHSFVARGKRANIESHPYQIGYYQVTENYEPGGNDYRTTKFCSGTIISKRWVVTAGHCVNRALNSNAFTEFICSGSSYINCKGGTLHKIDRRVLHPDYHEVFNKTINDIGLLRVKNPFVFTDRVRSIELATQWPGWFSIGTVSGWGANENGTMSPQLMETSHIIEPNFICKLFLGSKLLSRYQDSSIICSLSTSFICSGDSGGPLVIDNTLVGIISMGLANEFCKRLSFAQSFFTTIPKYINWIATTIYEDTGENVTILPFVKAD